MIGELVDKIARKDRDVVFPYTLSRKGLYILPTGQGVLFIVVLGVMLVGSINYANNLGFLFTFLLGSMAFISMLHTHRNLLGLTLGSASVPQVFAGDEAWLTVTVAQDDRPRIGVAFEIRIGASVHTVVSSEKTVSIPVPTGRRGLFAVETMVLSSSYPFGLFRTWTTFYPVLSYLVYPRAMGGEFKPSVSGEGEENQGGRETEGVDDFSGLRPYRPGDPLGRLSWKSYARGKGLHTKEFSALTGDAVMISWDDVPVRDTEKKLSRLCDMVLAAHDMNLAYGLSIPGAEIPMGEPKDKAHRHECLKALALFGQKSPGAKGRKP